MIRFALALLGLSAGAADAQRLVPLASVLENCGLHVEVQADETNNASDCTVDVVNEVTDTDGSVPQVPPVAMNDVVVPVRAVVQRPVLLADPVGAKAPQVFSQADTINVFSCVLNVTNNGLHPIETDSVFAVAMDGSDPSAMICP